MNPFTESTVESAALDWLAATGWQVAHGPDTVLHAPGADSMDYREMRVKDAEAFLKERGL